MTDPIVAEVRKHRMQHTRKFGGDLRKICAELRSVQEKLDQKVLRLPAQRPRRGTGRRAPV